MNPIKTKIVETLNDFQMEFGPLKEHSLKYIKYASIRGIAQHVGLSILTSLDKLLNNSCSQKQNIFQC